MYNIGDYTDYDGKSQVTLSVAKMKSFMSFNQPSRTIAFDLNQASIGRYTFKIVLEDSRGGRTEE